MFIVSFTLTHQSEQYIVQYNYVAILYRNYDLSSDDEHSLVYHGSNDAFKVYKVKSGGYNDVLLRHCFRNLISKLFCSITSITLFLKYVLTVLVQDTLLIHRV